MKLSPRFAPSLITALVLAVILGCASPPRSCPLPPLPHVGEPCERASRRLAQLSCPEARPDFPEVCRHLVAENAYEPTWPECVGSISSCDEVDKCP